jgi:WD40 repeat protein
MHSFQQRWYNIVKRRRRQTCAYTPIHTCIHKYIHTYQTYIHTYTHTYIHTYIHRCIAFSKDGTTLLSAGDDKHVKVWGVLGVPAIKLMLIGHTWSDVCVCVCVRVWVGGIPAIRLMFIGHTWSDLCVCVYVCMYKYNICMYVDGDWTHMVIFMCWVINNTRATTSPSCRKYIYAYIHTRIHTQGNILRTLLIWQQVHRVANTYMHTYTHAYILRAIYSVHYSSDNKSIVSGSADGRMIIWDAVTGRQKRVLDHNLGMLFCTSWLTQSSFVACSGRNRVVRIWDVNSGKQVTELKGHRDDVWALDFSEDGTVLASGSLDKCINVWSLKGVCVRETVCVWRCWPVGAWINASMCGA